MNSSFESFDDFFDENILVNSYDKAFNIASETLAKQIAMKTNKTASSADCKQKKNGNHSASDVIDKHLAEGNDESDTTTPVEVNLKAGGFVRATYIDGVDYEAKILSINLKAGTCIIKYIGYNNEQEVPIASLIASWGKKARKLQIAKAKSIPVEDIRFKPPMPRMPPMPPMPPMVNTDSEHLSAMLISWYMSGYYTGVYQTLERNRSHSRKTKQMPNTNL